MDLGALSSYLNRNRDALCLALMTIHEAIVQWSTKINDFAVDQLGKQRVLKGKPMTVDDVKNFYSLEFDLYQQIVAPAIIDTLKDVKNRYDRGELGGLAGKMDIGEIIKIQNLLKSSDSGFFHLVKNDADVINLATVATVPTYAGEHHVEQLKRWMDSINSVRTEVLSSIYSQLRDLECKQKSIDTLRKQVFGK